MRAIETGLLSVDCLKASQISLPVSNRKVLRHWYKENCSRTFRE
jgi:hypothetical protein